MGPSSKIALAALLGSTTLCVPSIALAADSTGTTAQVAQADQNNGGIEEVVVTARKRPESIQRVPESIIALSQDAIRQQQIRSERDLQVAVPGFSVQTGIAEVFTGLYSLRGLAMLNVGQNTDPTTATYVDGIYQGFSATNLGLEDLQNIQVLEGPQGTLFGRNSTGGAVLINHNLPTDQFEGWARAGYGNYNQYDLEAMVNVPLAGDKVGFRVVGGYIAHDGYGTATLGGGAFNAATEPDFTQFGGTFASPGCSVTPCRRPVDDLASYNVFATLQAKPTSDLDIVVRAGYVRGSSAGAAGNLTFLSPLGVGAFEAGSELGIPGYNAAAQFFLSSGGCGGNPPLNCPGQFATLLGGVPAIQHALLSQTSGNTLNSIDDLPNFDRASKVTASATISYDVADNLQLKSITGYVEGKRFLQQDLDSSSFSIETSLQNTTETLWTEELQAVGNAFDNRLKYTAGFYYYHKDALDDQEGFTAPLLLLVPQSLFGVTEQASSPSGYAQGTFAVTPEINITGGVRYTEETKKLQQNTFASFVIPAFNFNPLVTACATVAGCPVGTFTGTNHFTSYDDNISYLGEIDYTPIENLMAYFKTSDAFRSGGPQESAPPGIPNFKPEQVTDYELGVKSELLDDRLRLNADIYREVYRDVQQTLFLSSGGALFNAVVNMGNALVDGFELQVEAIPIDNLTLSGNFSLMDPRYTSVSALAVSNGITVKSPFANVQRFAYTLSGNYRIPADAGDVNLHLDWHWQSTTPETPGFTFGPTGQGTTVQNPFGLLNSRISFKPGNRDWEVALWGKNLTNQRYFSYIFNSTGTPGNPGGLGFITASSNAAPLTFGADVTWSF